MISGARYDEMLAAIGSEGGCCRSRLRRTVPRARARRALEAYAKPAQNVEADAAEADGKARRGVQPSAGRSSPACPPDLLHKGQP